MDAGLFSSMLFATVVAGTPLVIVALGTTDLIFALDSISAPKA